tara:strand:- start:1819 stop:2583 length:765 start_codon:yes stop_codon:yes gene_type:complete
MLLHSKILGESSPEVLILHGFLGSGDNWLSIARELCKKNIKVHLIDQRNHGRSFHTESFNYDDMCNDLLYYIKHYKITKPILLGHSMGGKTAMQFCLKYPELISKVFIMDIAPKYYPNHNQHILDALKTIDLEKFNQRKEIEKALSNSITMPEIRGFIMKSIFRKSNNKFGIRFNLQSLSKNVEIVGKEISSPNKFLKRVFFFKGEKSSYINLSDHKLIYSFFPNADVIEIKNAGHWLHRDNMSDVLRHLQANI